MLIWFDSYCILLGQKIIFQHDNLLISFSWVFNMVVISIRMIVVLICKIVELI